MSIGARLGTRTNTSARDSAAWPAAFVVLAIAMPLDNAIGANAFFLRTHQVSGWAWIALQLAVTAAGWLILWGLLALVQRKAGARAFDISASIVAIVVGWFCAANGLGAEPHLAEATAGLPGWLWWVVGLIVALLLTQLSRKAKAGTILLAFTSVASLLPILLATIGASSSSISATAQWKEGERPSVLWIIADELNAHALIDDEGKVRDSYPNIAALQSQSTTYETTYGLSNKTERAIPAMMAGLPDIGAETDERMNALGESVGVIGGLADEYSIVWSSGIFAPPPGAGPCNSDGRSWLDEAKVFGADVAAVVGNTALVDPLRGAFPSIDAKWRDFWEETSPGWTTVAKSRIQCAANSSDPFFAVWHTLTTHNPYVYGRDGYPLINDSMRTIGSIDPGLNRSGEVSNESIYEFQRRLYANSVANLDRRVGQVLDVLKDAGRFDDTMVIFTADHGVALTEARRDGSGGEDERRVGADSAQMWGEIARVPLIVKYPGEQDPDLVESARTSAQILPTVLEVTGASIETPWPMQPPLSQDPDLIAFTLRHLGEWTSFTFDGNERFDPWTTEQASPDPQFPFAIGVDPALLGGPVPTGATQLAAEAYPVQGSSAQHLYQFATNQRCSTDTTLLSANVNDEEVVVGSVVWESSDAPSARGWAIVPASFDRDLKTWCQG